MVIELFGLPGSGKSFLCDKIQELGYAKNIMKFYKENFIGKVIFHLFLNCFTINKKLKKLYNDSLKIIGNTANYKNQINSSIPINLYVKYMVYIFFLENNIKKNIIIDEGIMHYSMALHAEYDLELEKIEEIIKLYEVKSKQTYCLKCDKDIILMQIKKRNRKNTSIDFLEENELNNILEKYSKAQEFLVRKYKINYLNINEIISKIEERKNGKI